MNKILLSILCLLPFTVNAGYLFEQKDATDIYYDDDIQGPIAFKNNWYTDIGDTWGYVSFEAYTPFKAEMYVFAYNYNPTYPGSPCVSTATTCDLLGDVIAYGGNGSFGPFGYNQKISGFLDEFVDVEGVLSAGYALYIGPEGLTEEMIRNNDVSFIEEFFQDSNYGVTHLGSEYDLAVTYPIFETRYTDRDYSTAGRPEGVVTLNEQYLARVSAANVPEPTTTALLSLAIAGGLMVRRKRAIKK